MTFPDNPETMTFHPVNFVGRIEPVQVSRKDRRAIAL